MRCPWAPPRQALPRQVPWPPQEAAARAAQGLGQQGPCSALMWQGQGPTRAGKQLGLWAWHRSGLMSPSSPQPHSLPVLVWCLAFLEGQGCSGALTLQVPLTGALTMPMMLGTPVLCRALGCCVTAEGPGTSATMVVNSMHPRP